MEFSRDKVLRGPKLFMCARGTKDINCLTDSAEV